MLALASRAALFDAVSARVEQLPEDDRPRLLVYGESLGTAGGEAAFDGLADMRLRTDGVLWTGPPNSNVLWSELVDRRDPATGKRKRVVIGTFGTKKEAQVAERTALVQKDRGTLIS